MLSPSAHFASKASSSIESALGRVLGQDLVQGRTVQFPGCGSDNEFVSNRVTTSKYTLISFLPVNLLEQFRKQANLYFLIISIIMCLGETQFEVQTKSCPLAPVENGKKTPTILHQPYIGTIKYWSTASMLALMMLVSAIFAAHDDIRRHRADRQMNSRQISFRKSDGTFDKKRWDAVKVGDVLWIMRGEEIPADTVVLSSSSEHGTCFVATANLDGETNLKPKTPSLPKHLRTIKDLNVNGSLLEIAVEAEKPHKSIYNFIGSLSVSDRGQALPKTPLGPMNLLLRGCKLRNVDWCLGLVVYTGSDTRIQMNQRSVPLKMPKIDISINKAMWLAIAVQTVMALGTDIAYLGERHTLEKIQNYGESLSLVKPSWPPEIAYMITFFVLYSNLMPVSLYATMEICNGAYAYFINRDLAMVDKNRGEDPPRARSTNLCHELGQVSYVFSDKTGTLTQNIMELKYVTINGVDYSVDSPIAGTTERGTKAFQFFECLALAHTVMRDNEGGYEGESPDEEAFVKAAVRFGWDFRDRTQDHVIVRVGELEQRYRLLALNPFDSTRKKMSVVVEDPAGNLLLLVKGADTAMQLSLDWQECINKYSSQGLRSLAIGRRVLDRDSFEEWFSSYKEAETAIENREEKLMKVANKIENGSEILGFTAIKDKLQENVGETIEALRQAGVKLWVLTGDNLRTAFAIGFSTKVLANSMHIMTMKTEHDLQRIADNHQAWRAHKQGDLALLFEGSVFEKISPRLKRTTFLSVATDCKVVIACRISPLQKAEVVALVRDNVKVPGLSGTPTRTPVTLAIGDGANDVPMIQEAQVGVGIYGREGRQAAMTGDFAISQFQYLQRLMLVHGHWNYRRVAKVILFTFWRNAVQSLLMCFYTYQAAYSGTPLFEDKLRITFNGLCTIPIIGPGIFDRDVREEVALSNPHLYALGHQGRDLNRRTMMTTLIHAVVHSCIIWGVYTGCRSGFLLHQIDDYWSVNTILYTMLVCGVNYRAAHLTTTWNLPNVLLQLASLLGYSLYLSVYNFVCLTSAEKVPWRRNLMYMVPGHVCVEPMFWVCLGISLSLQFSFDMLYSYLIHKFCSDRFEQIIWRDHVKRSILPEGDDLLNSIAFSWQKLKSIQLVHRPAKTVLTLGLAAIFFFLMALLLKYFNQDAQPRGVQYGYYYQPSSGTLPPWPKEFEVEAKYGSLGAACQISTDSSLLTERPPCEVEIQIPPSWLGQRILVAYVLHPFYQNAFYYTKDHCLAYRTYFNDTFEVYANGELQDLAQDHIAWESDKHVLKTYSIPVSDRHEWNRRAVWMRPGATPMLFKRYGFLTLPRDSGIRTLTTRINTAFPNMEFGTNKAVVLAIMPHVFGIQLEFALWCLSVTCLISAMCVIKVETRFSQSTWSWLWWWGRDGADDSARPFFTPGEREARESLLELQGPWSSSMRQNSANRVFEATQMS
mmetsp:Transcript_16967/g.39553  ORF Transcript_16967/g.39553 Transcript_16967/m.39553 type:complete len:1442 (-) Transcript_16967:153-4478(-)